MDNVWYVCLPGAYRSDKMSLFQFTVKQLVVASVSLFELEIVSCKMCFFLSLPHICLSTYQVTEGVRGCCQDTAHWFPCSVAVTMETADLSLTARRISNWPFSTFAPDIMVQFKFCVALSQGDKLCCHTESSDFCTSLTFTFPLIVMYSFLDVMTTC